MKKKILSTIIAVLLIAGALPVSTLTAFAEGESYTLTIKYAVEDSNGIKIGTEIEDKVITGIAPGTVIDLSAYWPDKMSVIDSNGTTCYFLNHSKYSDNSNSQSGCLFYWVADKNDVIYAYYENWHPPYELTLDPNGGTVNCQKILRLQDPFIYLSSEGQLIPVRDGYEFLGWSLDKNELSDQHAVVEDSGTIYAIWEKLSSVQVGMTTLYDGEYIRNGSTQKQTGVPTGTGYAYYTGGVLKLNNFEYEGAIENDGFIYTASDLDIEFTGDNIIKDTGESASLGVIYANANLNIYGGGSLTVSSLKNTGIRGYEITAKNVTLNIESSGEGSYGLQCNDKQGKGLSLENVTANITVGERGISSGNTMTIKDCDLDISAGRHGIWANKGLEITNSKVISIADSIALNHNQTAGKLTLKNGHYILECNSDEHGAMYFSADTLELPTSDFYYRTEKNADFVKNSVVPFAYNKQKYIEIFTEDIITPVRIQWSADTSFTYDGTEKVVTATIKNKTDVNDDVELVLSGNKATDADNYTATVTGLTGKDAVKYTLDGGQQNITKNWEIAKAVPNYTAPTGLTATEGQTLKDVKLPADTNGVWTWQDETLSVGNVGKNKFKVTFTPNDTTNYTTVTDIEIEIDVNAVPQPNPDSPAVHTHHWNLTRKYNKTHCWYECFDCGAKDEYEKHTYKSAADTTCERCAYVRVVVTATPTPEITPEPQPTQTPQPTATPTPNAEPTATPAPQSTGTSGTLTGTNLLLIGGAGILTFIFILWIIFKRRKDD